MFRIMDINCLAVLAAAIANIILGSIWYSRPVFGRMWMKLSGAKPKANAKGMWKYYLVALLGSFVTAWVIARLFNTFGIATLANAMLTMLMAWLGFVAAIMIGMVLWEGKPWKLYFLHVLYYLASFLLMGFIIFSWQ